MTQYTPAQARKLADQWPFEPFLKEALRSLADQVEELQADAARYRWLRDKSEPGICAFYLSVGKAFDGVKFNQDTVDTAIDAQIKGPAAGLRPDPGAVKTCATCSQCTRHRGGNVCQLHRCATSLDSYCKDWNAVTKDTQ